ALGESPIQQGLLYYGTDRGGLWVTHDDGAQWHDHTVGLPPNYIRSIHPSRHAKARVYVALSGLNYDDLHAHLYASDDYGKSWRSIVSNLPDEVAYTILEDPRYEDVLYAGMYRGVYVSTDRGASWELLGRDMPAVAVADLVIQEREQDLIAGTHGRGVYRLDLATLYESIEQTGTWQDRLFETPTAYTPHANDTVPNPSLASEERVPISFSLAHAASLSVEVVNDQGETLWTRSFEGRRGLNQFRWDLIHERRTSSGPYFTRQVNFLKAGDYSLRITGEDLVLEGLLRVKAGQAR
ncbi:MAG: hypothetical protein ACI9HE_000561, partial [Planctomycetota bacterium]